MAQKVIVQTPSPPFSGQIAREFASLVSVGGWTQVDVISAYASVAGVRKLHTAVTSVCPNAAFRWLIGLDDCFTQPSALRLCMTLHNSQLKVVTLAAFKARFHPKLYFLDGRPNPPLGSMLVGSSNLTVKAFTTNCEAAAILEASTPTDAARLRSAFNTIWASGKDYTPQLEASYSKSFQAKASRDGESPEKEGVGAETGTKREVLASDAAAIDPSQATTCWIEVGKTATPAGRELEFKAEQALFFGLNPTGGEKQARRFRVSDGKKVDLNLSYRNNAMWRLDMTVDVPEVKKGLLPKVNGKPSRSPFVAVIRRIGTKGIFDLTFVRLKSAAHRFLRQKSIDAETLGSTTAREYGWF